jgi:hypothetical protein
VNTPPKSNINPRTGGGIDQFLLNAIQLADGKWLRGAYSHLINGQTVGGQTGQGPQLPKPFDRGFHLLYNAQTREPGREEVVHG